MRRRETPVRRDDYERTLRENAELRKALKDIEDQKYRSRQFWRCAHGWHKMDRATRVPTFPTPGHTGACKRCGIEMREVLL